MRYDNLIHMCNQPIRDLTFFLLKEKTRKLLQLQKAIRRY